MLIVKSPVDGSSGDFHEVSDQLTLGFRLNPSFTPGRCASVKKSKLCHKKWPYQPVFLDPVFALFVDDRLGLAFFLTPPDEQVETPSVTVGFPNSAPNLTNKTLNTMSENGARERERVGSSELRRRMRVSENGGSQRSVPASQQSDPLTDMKPVFFWPLMISSRRTPKLNISDFVEKNPFIAYSGDISTAKVFMVSGTPFHSWPFHCPDRQIFCDLFLMNTSTDRSTHFNTEIPS
ncbi:hypothetical protein Sjap_025408 [Stephania japonica]|uniref:Uncharacterized protein n=1 Tax=Stephania japonica TaxID=461633 RepID=A0AAP0E552_9MAGN